MMKGKEFWGPSEWRAMHYKAGNALKNPKKKPYFDKFLRTLPLSLPCFECGEHFKNLLSQIPPEKAKNPFEWSYTAHDIVNKRLSKENPSQPKISPPIATVTKEFVTEPNLEEWGRSEWRAMHSKAVTYVPTKSRAMEFVKYINLLPNLLPNEWGKLFEKIITDIPVTQYLNSNHDLFFWTYLIHNEVNKVLGKKSPKYIKVKTEYFRALNEACKECEK